jgi:hypothetical protein
VALPTFLRKAGRVTNLRRGQWSESEEEKEKSSKEREENV